MLPVYCRRKEAAPIGSPQFLSAAHILVSDNRRSKEGSCLCRGGLDRGLPTQLQGGSDPSAPAAAHRKKGARPASLRWPPRPRSSRGPPVPVTGSPEGAAANATAQWRALRTLELSNGAQAARGNAHGRGGRAPRGHTFASALPTHAVDEAALAAARAAVLSGPSKARFSTNATCLGTTMVQRAALSACCGRGLHGRGRWCDAAVGDCRGVAGVGVRRGVLSRSTHGGA